MFVTCYDNSLMAMNTNILFMKRNGKSEMNITEKAFWHVYTIQNEIKVYLA